MKLIWFTLLLFAALNVVFGFQWPTQNNRRSNYGYYAVTRQPSDEYGTTSAQQNYFDQRRKTSDVWFPTQRAPRLRTTTTTTTARPTTTTTTTDAPTTERPWNKRHSDFSDLFDNDNTNDQKPPVAVILALNNISDPLEFINKFVIPKRTPLLGSSDTPTDPKTSLLERTLSYPFAPAASCTPQPTTVPITLKGSPYDFFVPSCTRVERCGGCCTHELLECAPLKKENVTYQVYKTRYLGPPSNKFDSGEMVTVDLEKHLECQCQCRIKADDCNRNQVYRPNECRCECGNVDDLKNCVGERIWDPSTCTCKCREYRECSTGYFFNFNTCICETRGLARIGPRFRGF